MANTKKKKNVPSVPSIELSAKVRTLVNLDPLVNKVYQTSTADGDTYPEMLEHMLVALVKERLAKPA